MLKYLGTLGPMNRTAAGSPEHVGATTGHSPPGSPTVCLSLATATNLAGVELAHESQGLALPELRLLWPALNASRLLIGEQTP